MMIIAVVAGALIVLLFAYLGITWWLLAREDDRINREPWMPGLVIRASRLELVSEGYRVDEFIEYAAAVLDG